MKKHAQTLVMLLCALSLVLGSIALTGCTGGSSEQDNCYGEDMPVVNE